MLYLLAPILLCLSMQVFADPAPPSAKIECKLEFSKPSCWDGYSIYVEMIDAITQKTFQNFELKANDLNIIVNYDCQKHPQINFRARYSPNIWKDDEKKSFTSTKVWDIGSKLADLPTATAETTTTFTIQVIFPDHFSEVPSPAVCDEGKALPKIPTRE